MTDCDFTSGIKFSLDGGSFICRVTEAAMAPRYRPGEFFLVQPDTAPELGDDVLVRLNTGKTMLKRLVAADHGITLADYQDDLLLMLESPQVTHCLFVAGRVPARDLGEPYQPFARLN
jgi:hypothetical protein